MQRARGVDKVAEVDARNMQTKVNVKHLNVLKAIAQYTNLATSCALSSQGVRSRLGWLETDSDAYNQLLDGRAVAKL